MILAGALTVVCIGLWASGLLPEIVTTLLFFSAATLTGVASPATIFSGFASSAFWLVLGGMVVGMAMTRTGLGARLGRGIAGPLSGSYPLFIAGLVALAFALAFVMPSNMGRIALLVPTVLAVADELGLRPGNPGRVGAVLAVGVATPVLSTAILPANVPNLVMASAADGLYGLRFTFLHYLALNAPVLGLVKGALLVALICRLFPDKVARPATTVALPPLDGAERRLALILAGTLLLWLSDTWHHIQPAWIGLSAATLCLLPRIGVLPAESFAALNLRTCFYIAGLLGLVAVAVESGLGAWLGRALVSVAPLHPGAPASSFATLVGISTALTMVVTTNGAPAIYTPLAAEFAQASGLGLNEIVMAQVVGFSTVFLPYQAAPILVALQLGGVRIGEAARLTVPFGLVSLVVCGPLTWLWWRAIGAWP